MSPSWPPSPSTFVVRFHKVDGAGVHVSVVGPQVDDTSVFLGDAALLGVPGSAIAECARVARDASFPACARWEVTLAYTAAGASLVARPYGEDTRRALAGLGQVEGGIELADAGPREVQAHGLAVDVIERHTCTWCGDHGSTLGFDGELGPEPGRRYCHCPAGRWLRRNHPPRVSAEVRELAGDGGRELARDEVRELAGDDGDEVRELAGGRELAAGDGAASSPPAMTAASSPAMTAASSPAMTPATKSPPATRASADDV